MVMRSLPRGTAPLVVMLAAVLSLGGAIEPVEAEIVPRAIDYTDAQGTALEGQLVAESTWTDRHPGVLVVPDWRGITDTTLQRAMMLAKLGYVAFAVDIYGKGVHPHGVAEWSAAAGKYKSDRPLFRQRARAAYETLVKLPGVNSSRVAAIGFCFGGTGVMEMAKDGLPLRGVVSFHGGLDASPLSLGQAIHARVLALCGADDPFESPKDFGAFEAQLREAGVDYQIVKYGHAVHAFTDPGVDALNLPGARYNAAADHRSWQAMQDFFHEIFASS